MNTPLEIITKFVLFSFNFDYEFIENAYTDKIGKVLTDHLRSKFNGYCSDYGSSEAMLRFYCALGTDNREILVNYIMNNYKG